MQEKESNMSVLCGSNSDPQDKIFNLHLTPKRKILIISEPVRTDMEVCVKIQRPIKSKSTHTGVGN